MQLVWYGVLHNPTGYANTGRHFVYSLDKLGVNIKAVPTADGLPSLDVYSDVAAAINNSAQRPDENKKIMIQCLTPERYVHKPDGVLYNLGLFTWETTKIHPTWVQICNQMDGILALGSLAAKAIKESGVTVPVVAIKQGIEFYNAPPHTKLNLPDDVFKFLSVFQWSVRKAPDILIKAYTEEFTSKDRVALILKTSGWTFSPIEAAAIMMDIKLIRRSCSNKDQPPIYIYPYVLSDVYMSALYESVDAFVLPSRGEGVGLPYMEAMGNGLPTIGTAWGGQTDFMNNSNSYLIDYKMVPVSPMPHAPWYLPDEQQWAEPDLKHTRALMRHVYENQSEAVLKGKVARGLIRSEFTHEAAAKTLIEAVKDITGISLI